MIIDVKNRSIKSVEVLVSWKHSKYQLVNPDEFIHYAESSGRIVELDLWVLGQCFKCIYDKPCLGDLIQGFYFSKPKLLSEIAEKVEEEKNLYDDMITTLEQMANSVTTSIVRVGFSSRKLAMSMN